MLQLLLPISRSLSWPTVQMYRAALSQVGTAIAWGAAISGLSVTFNASASAAEFLAQGVSRYQKSPLESGARENVLYRFKGGADGAGPLGPVIADGSGSLYGTTSSGGGVVSCNDTCGTVYKLTKSGGRFIENVIYSFQGGSDGEDPVGGLVIDFSGALYGVTAGGGTGQDCNEGCGTVYKLTHGTSGFTKRILYSFRGGLDGAYPAAGLATDRQGALYGTTYYGGGTPCDDGVGCGTVFKLTPTKSGYRESILYSFKGGHDGLWPAANVIVVENGVVYGTTTYGGTASQPPCANGCGTVFALTPASGGYSETILHSFQVPPDGNYPASGLIMDRNGSVYGTTQYGGSSVCNTDCGTVFRLSPSRSGYVETILHYFQGASDGAQPVAGLVSGMNGTLLGTTTAGGTGCALGCGTVYELKPIASNSAVSDYLETVLYRFTSRPDGAGPEGLIRQNNGKLYGVTFSGGELCDCGTAFEVTL